MTVTTVGVAVEAGVKGVRATTDLAVTTDGPGL